MNYYQFHIADWALHTSHLTVEEEGVYRRLLDYYYDTESPIPEETQSVIRRLRLGSYEETVALILAEFFILRDGAWHNLRADREIQDYNNKAEVARANGKKGGRPKKQKQVNQEVMDNQNPEETQPVNLANPEKTGSKANQEPRTINQEPDIHTSPAKSDDMTDCPYQQIIDLYHEKLPTLNRVKVITEPRKKALRARWRENAKHRNLEFWQNYFDYVSQSAFLMGEAKDWAADFDFLIKQSKFVSVIEGKYHGDKAA